MENTAGNQQENSTAAGAEKGTQQQEKSFTQEDVNRIVGERLARVKAEMESADALRMERDEARRELETYKNNAFLKEKGIKEEDMDYVIFKAQKLVNENTDFRQAVEQFLKDNPRFSNARSYRVFTGASSSSNGSGHLSDVNDPAAIRKAMGLKG